MYCIQVKQISVTLKKSVICTEFDMHAEYGSKVLLNFSLKMYVLYIYV